jgi:hypothetical protein
MQVSYLHGVPKKKSPPEGDDNLNRLVVVFRRGERTEYTKDSGHPCTNLDLVAKPPSGACIFGHLDELVESEMVNGKVVSDVIYTRFQLVQMGAHRYVFGVGMFGDKTQHSLIVMIHFVKQVVAERCFTFMFTWPVTGMS